MAWQHRIHKIQKDTDMATFGTQNRNRHWPGNIGYTWYKQTLAWQHWVPKIQTGCQANVCLYLVDPMFPDPCLFVSCVPNVARPVSGYKQTMAWQQWVHKIQSDTELVTFGTQNTNRQWPGNIGYTRYTNVAMSVSVCILCNQCCQASVCLYLVYPMLPGQCLFVSCVPNVARPVSVCKQQVCTTVQINKSVQQCK
jgi:hypothetical protein